MLTNEPYCKVLPMDHYSKVLLFLLSSVNKNKKRLIGQEC